LLDITRDAELAGNLLFVEPAGGVTQGASSDIVKWGGTCTGMFAPAGPNWNIQYVAGAVKATRN